ncbi:MAG: hypothetical protein PHD65_10425 [Gallionella sp.]|nr:hypothetical protein [Gallionella sp.]
MTESHVVSALVAKRAELTGRIEHFQSQIRQISMDVDHLDATLQLFDSDYDLLSIKPKGIRSSNPWFAKGEISRLTLDALRTATAPLSTCDIADVLIARKSIITEGTKERDRLIKSLLWALQQMRKREVVKMVGKIKGAGGGPMLWMLA